MAIVSTQGPFARLFRPIRSGDIPQALPSKIVHGWDRGTYRARLTLVRNSCQLCALVCELHKNKNPGFSQSESTGLLYGFRFSIGTPSSPSSGGVVRGRVKQQLESLVTIFWRARPVCRTGQHKPLCRMLVKIGRGWPFGRSGLFFFLEKRHQNTRRSRVTAPFDLKPPQGWLSLGLGLASGWSGPMCKVEIDHSRPAQSFFLVPTSPAHRWSRSGAMGAIFHRSDRQVR